MKHVRPFHSRVGAMVLCALVAFTYAGAAAAQAMVS